MNLIHIATVDNRGLGRVTLRPRVRWIAFGMVASGAAAAIVGLVLQPARTWPTLLLSDFYVLSVCLGAALFIAIQFLSGAAWWVGLRRVPEAMLSALPAAAILVLTVFFGRHSLYEWSRPGAFAETASLAGKAAYLSSPFVFTRMVIVLLVWMVIARKIRLASLRQDLEAGMLHHRRIVRYSAIFVVTFALTFSVAGVDWLMSLDPHWFSTIFAVYLFAGLFVLALAAVTLAVVLLLEGGHLADVVNANHLHDLGKLIFAFSTFWAYIWVSQYLLIWYGNLPEEIPFYATRTSEPWIALFLLNPVLNWGVPFLVLLPRAAKRHATVLKWVCLVILLGRWLDLYLIITPSLAPAPAIGALEVLIPIGYAGLFVLLVVRGLASAPLVPLNDPYLSESLAHHQ